MNVILNFTPFRRMIRALSIYSEKSRSDDLDGKVIWNLGDNIRIFGYQQPDYQTRLTDIRLNKNSISTTKNNHSDFRTEVPETWGMGTVTDGGELVIKIEPGQDYLTICTDNFRYGMKKSWETKEMHINKYYLPMDQIKIKGAILKNSLQNFARISPRGPLKLQIRENKVKFVTESERLNASFDITDHVNVYSSNENIDYHFDIELLSDILKKLPKNEEIEIYVNDDLIRLRYEIGDDIGHVNYYQLHS